MNEAFRQYVFGRAFHLHLSDKQIEYLALICKGDQIATLGLDTQRHGLIRRGLIDHYVDETTQQFRIRPTKAGLLVYQLMVEAGEHAALEEKRLKTLEMEHEVQAAEWDRRFGEVQIKLKDIHLRERPARSDA